MFQQTGYLHGIGKIQVITVLMPLICTVLELEATNTNKAYLTFYMMLSSDINDILSPKFEDDAQIDTLYLRIVETLVVHEGLYPITETLIHWHQLMDIVQHIKKCGPLRCWWEFNGERSLADLKKEVPEGGASYDKTVMKSSSMLEEIKMQDTFNFSLEDFTAKLRLDNDINNFDNFSVNTSQLEYSDEKFFMTELINSSELNHSDMKFNQYEIELLLDLFIIEIKKTVRNKNEAYHSSPVFRMYAAYLHHCKNSTKSFYTFLNECIDLESVLHTQYCKRKRESAYFIFAEESAVYTEIEDQFFIFEDLEIVRTILFNFYPLRFKKSIVYGIRMESRGTVYAERVNSIDNLSTNPLNVLKKNWYGSKDNLSSWFKYRYDEQSDIRDEKFGFGDYKQFCYGQFNYFFRVYLPGDMILHGLPLASAVCRFADIDKYMNIIDISTNQESFVLRQPFVALTNVFSTKLLVGGRDIFKMPIKLKKRYHEMSTGTMVRKFSNKNPTDACDLYFLDLEPYRRTVKFDALNRTYYRFEYAKKQYIE
jgi:hypothetical protein